MRKAAVLAVILHTQSRLIVECFGKVGGIHHFKKFGAHHVYHHRSCLTAHFIAIGRYYDLICHEALLLHLEMYNGGEVFVHLDLLFLCFIAYRGYAQGVFARRKVLEFKLAFFIRHRSLSAAHYQNSGIRYVLLRAFHKDMAGNHIAFPDGICSNSCVDACHGKHQRQYIMFHLNNRFFK